MLENFTETQNSDNRHHNLNLEKPEEICVGGTATHTFILPFKYSECISNCKILYRQGIETILEKYPADCTFTELSNGNTVVSVPLSKEDTALFNRPIFKTYVQIKLETIANETLYNRLIKVNVITPIADLTTPNDEEE